ncbi:amidase [Bradyrhizobium sp. SSBR45G]|uniref:amidase n=1 Tax=unclassified Bradyrhizobium TaxID=2631580 RepID=UPI002342AB6D|nr:MULTISPECIES: amidase [unclassified Bradyrhizobium]GLH76929.1 amidase [Bradyrhizobium sp. SSBR45G]GLH83687.1 amidase [Bradyrhizobium sp. SSBR45R]
MPQPSVSESPRAGAGVLELLRRFAADPAAAATYGEDCLRRTQAIEPQLKAFEYLPRDVTAKAGPLSGIPVAIKDIIATSDMPTTNGSAIYRDHVPDADAWVVERLRQLGATIFGKTVSTEFAWRHPGPTVNPWNPAHTPGGSSSGSAAAVAAGLVPLALGTQTLGSVIRPAAFNGVVGFKPSFGAIPRVGVHPLSPSLDHIGFFARRVDDAAFALSLLAGTSADDVHGRPLPAFAVDVAHGLTPLARPRLAVARFAKWERVETEQKAVFEKVIATLRSAGAVVEDIALGELDAVNGDAVTTIMLSEATTIFSDLIARYPDRVSDVMKAHVESGRRKTAMEYLAAKAAQAARQRSFAAEIDGFDAVLTLPAFGEAPRGLDWTGDAEYCAPWTFLGAPAVALPAGFGKNGLPLGVQITGPYRNDLHLLRVAKWAEATLAFDPGVPLLARA